MVEVSHTEEDDTRQRHELGRVHSSQHATFEGGNNRMWSVGHVMLPLVE
jgi:hypothetical protein